MLNIHTHTIPTDPSERFVLNCDIGGVPSSVACCSVGLHPWQVDEDWKTRIRQLRHDVLLPNVVAIGECGLDALRGGAADLQVEAFSAQIELAEECHKPLIIHCVRCFDTLIQLHKKYNPQELWIVHGFRGKPQLALQLAKLGMRLSFGLNFNPDTLKAIASAGKPYFLETDDSGASLQDVMEAVGKCLG